MCVTALRLFIDLIFRVVSMAWGRLGFEITMELGDMFAVTETGGAAFFCFVESIHFLTPPLLKSTSFKLAYYYFIIFLKKKQYFRETKFVKQKWLDRQDGAFASLRLDLASLGANLRFSSC